jgi:hypothetical protein
VSWSRFLPYGRHVTVKTMNTTGHSMNAFFTERFAIDFASKWIAAWNVRDLGRILKRPRCEFPPAVALNRAPHGTIVPQGFEEKMERVRSSFFARI